MKRLRKIKYIYFIILILAIILYVFLSGILPTLSRYYNEITTNVVGYGVGSYTINYELNGGIQAEGQVTSFESKDLPMQLSSPTKEGNTFLGWYQDSSFSGDPISVIESANNYTLYAKWLEMVAVAEIDGTYYSTLQAAVAAVPTDNTKTTIKLLANTSELITVAENKNIKFNLQNYTLSNNGSNRVIINNGTIEISNGIITSSATNCGAIDNNSTGKIIMNGGKIIISTGGRQAIYNNGGIVEISDEAYLCSESKTRPTITNLNAGNLKLIGGTIISSQYWGVDNAGNMTIGIKDGNVDRNSPIIQGNSYGIKSTKNFQFYDGIIRGKTAAIDDETYISDKETGYDVVHKDEQVENYIYKRAYLAIAKMVTFNANGGNLSETTRAVEPGQKIGELPEPTKNDLAFVGWFTLIDGGEQITENTIVTDDVTYYAHWSDDITAKIGDFGFLTLQRAVDYVKLNEPQVTIKLLKNTSENVVVKANKNILFDMQNYLLKNTRKVPAIWNYGNIEIINANMLSELDNGVIDNEIGANLKLNGGRVIATGGRQSIYNNGGNLEITGNAYLCSNVTGTPEDAILQRATVQNLKDGNIVIKSATIISTTQNAISNEGTLVIGVKEDGNVSDSSPVIIGENYGVESTKTFEFYDGIIKGITNAVSGTITEIETGTQEVNDTEIIDEKTYKTLNLELVP